MKRFGTIMCLIVAALLFTPAAFAQYHDSGDHVEFGIYGEYFRWAANNNLGFTGVGGRFAVNLTPHLQLEAETGYDFSQVFIEGFSAPGSGGTVAFTSRTHLRILSGLFGPKLETTGPVRLFVTAKGGAMSFLFSTRPATVGTYTSTVSALRDDNLIGTFYPGGGIEAFIGPIGLRVDAGDEMYFANGVHQNLRITFGPSIRF